MSGVVLVILLCLQTNKLEALLQGRPDLKLESMKLLNNLVKTSTPREVRLRMAILRRAQMTAGLHNSIPTRTFNMGLNKFSVLTGLEKRLYLGIENSTVLAMAPLQRRLTTTGTMDTPQSFDHRDKGHVTAVKDQGSCASCWSFAAVGAFEGSYSVATGITKSFSEKEALDCSYPPSKNGCKGGWYTAVWKYIKKTGRLATMRDAPYFHKSEECRWSTKPNGIRNADYISYYRARGSAAVERALTIYTPAVAFTVEEDFFSYNDGVYDGCPTPKKVNHGVILVGYAPEYWEAKNSWGHNWGSRGYVRFTRARENVCRITSYVMYPVVVYRDRGEMDEGDVIADDELENVSVGKTVISSDGSDASTAVDGDVMTCFSSKKSTNPYFKIDLEMSYRIQKIVIVSTEAEVKNFVGCKVHIGNIGNFLDKRVAVVEKTDSPTITLTLDKAVDGSRVYIEYYGVGETRSLTFCEVKVFGKSINSDDENGCPAGTIKCGDGVCRHAHMC